jgi:hypothetical protein
MSSVGPTTAVVLLRDDAIEQITLDLSGRAKAKFFLWDYGAPLRVEPVPTS